MVAVCRFLDVPLDARRRRHPARWPICADVRDPGNAGTVIRCADAAGADGVVLAGDSVDAYNPKTVRASVGSLFHLPLASSPTRSPRSARPRTPASRCSPPTAPARSTCTTPTSCSARPTAWLFGNEAWGLPAELAALADHRVRIPIHGRAESLNLSTAAALCLYATRARVQRR